MSWSLSGSNAAVPRQARDRHSTGSDFFPKMLVFFLKMRVPPVTILVEHHANAR
jgi:hypothetical protein